MKLYRTAPRFAARISYILFVLCALFAAFPALSALPAAASEARRVLPARGALYGDASEFDAEKAAAYLGFALKYAETGNIQGRGRLVASPEPAGSSLFYAITYADRKFSLAAVSDYPVKFLDTGDGRKAAFSDSNMYIFTQADCRKLLELRGAFREYLFARFALTFLSLAALVLSCVWAEMYAKRKRLEGERGRLRLWLSSFLFAVFFFFCAANYALRIDMLSVYKPNADVCQMFASAGYDYKETAGFAPEIRQAMSDLYRR